MPDPNQPYLDPDKIKSLMGGIGDKPMSDEYSRQMEMANQLRGGALGDTGGVTQVGRVAVASPWTQVGRVAQAYGGGLMADKALEGQKGLAGAAQKRREDYLNQAMGASGGDL